MKKVCWGNSKKSVALWREIKIDVPGKRLLKGLQRIKKLNLHMMISQGIKLLTLSEGRSALTSTIILLPTYAITKMYRE